MVLEGVAGIPVFFRFYRNFSQEFLRDRNSYIYSGFLRNPPEFRRIPVPAKSCWLWPAAKEGSLLSKIWTKIDIFNLSPEQDLTMVSLPPSSAGAFWPEGEGCRRGRDGTGRAGCVDGKSAGGCRVDDNNCNGRCRQQQTTNNNQQQARASHVWRWQRQRWRRGDSGSVRGSGGASSGLALWRGEAAVRTSTKVEAATEAAAATMATEEVVAEAAAAQQQQRCHGGGGGGRPGGRGDGGSSSGGGGRGSSGGNKGNGGNRGSGWDDGDKGGSGRGGGCTAAAAV